MGRVIPPSIKAIIGMMTSPTSLFVTICSVEQYRRPISWGMWYFSLKSSIFEGESTRFSNLTHLDEPRIKLLNPIDKKKSKNEWPRRATEEKRICLRKCKSAKTNVYDNLWYLREDVSKISQERKRVGIICILEKVRRVWVCDISEIWRLVKMEKWCLRSLYIRSWSE